MLAAGGFGRKIDRAQVAKLANTLVNMQASSVKQAEQVAALRRLTESGGIPSLETFFPLAFSLNSRPLTFKDHPQFSPMFMTDMPRGVVLVCARQVGKTQSQAAAGTLLCACVHDFKILYITPRYEQIRRFSTQYVRPLIENSPLRSLWLGPTIERSVLQRSMKNGAVQYFSFALLDADRTRGYSVDQNSFDEVQDMDPDHFSIISESMSHSSWGLTRYTGTPKSRDNPIHGLWTESSQAEWVVPCTHCTTLGFPTKNIASLDHHLEKMIGPWHKHISQETPATICHKCGKWINPRFGNWVHRRPHLRHIMAGYHVPQVVLPLHCERQDKWSMLLRKQNGWGNMSQAAFINEVLGETTDTGLKLVSQTELQAASSLPWANKPMSPDPRAVAAARGKTYKSTVLAIDWGGGGEKGVSFTVLAMMGIRSNGVIDVLWGRRLVMGCDAVMEAIVIKEMFELFRPDYIVHDYTGAGTIREATLTTGGLRQDRLLPIALCRSPRQFLRKVGPTSTRDRAHWLIDKAQSLLHTTTAIRFGRVRFFQWDYITKEEPGLITDFLALVENSVHTDHAGTIYTISRNILNPDDFAQAVNLGCVALWEEHDAWPNYAKVAQVASITDEQYSAAGDIDRGFGTDGEAFF